MKDWEYSLGDKSRFFFKLALSGDPDAGDGASPEESASWGHFQIWVRGQNLCAHTEEAESVESVHWYLLPFLEWLAENWDPLFHEEKLPVRVSGIDASRALHAAWLASEKRGLSDISPAEDRDIWWRRHCIQAARAGGLFPRLFLRRWRDDIEISWNTENLPGVPSEVDYQFLVPRGLYRLPVAEVVEPLYEVGVSCLDQIKQRTGESNWINEVQDKFAGIQTDNRHEMRLAWLAGLGRRAEQALERWKALRVKVTELSSEATAALFGVSENDYAVTVAPTAALLFGAMAPSVAETDVDTILQLLVDSVAKEGEGENETLARIERDVDLTIVDIGTQAWELADGVREELGVDTDTKVDIEKALQTLGVRITASTLTDERIRAISVAGPGLRPTLVVNDTYPWQEQPPVRRFTLAHELCHILFDRSRGSRVAVASGPWTAEDVERRANAFAAYFLMPYEVLENYFEGKEKVTQDDVVKVAASLETSASATLEHLYNVGLLSYADREVMRLTLHPEPMKKPRSRFSRR